MNAFRPHPQVDHQNTPARVPVLPGRLQWLSVHLGFGLAWIALLASDPLAAGLLVLLAVTAYVPLFFVNVVWFLPLALLPRGLCAELLLRRWAARRA